MSKNEQGKKWWEPAAKLFAELTVWVAGPIVLAVFVGHWLDQKYDKAPWLFLTSVGIAFIITNIAVVTKAMQAMQEISSEGEKKKTDSKTKN